ncbi:dehydrogenase/reductase SDR family member 7B-like [Lineus longissimus]|uniref:dehydrogenase/reductase SDR family member 7B-like n=1 Tax=Lineus longissimus TaxID=88925 RepID=UPI002B4C541C
MPSVVSTVASVLIPCSLCMLFWYFRQRKVKVDVRGKVVLITGASSGLGKACAVIFYKAGAKVILAARNLDALEKVKQELLALDVPNKKLFDPDIIQLDLADFDSIAKAAQAALGCHGNVHILINNAGMSYRGEILETSLEVQKKLMAVNYFGHVALTKALLPSMIEQREGHIVAVSSIQGKLSIPFRSAYSASKHAMQAFFDCLRAEAAQHNIQVCIVSPGYIKTNISLNAMTGDGSSYGVMDESTKTGMLPEDVAAGILSAVRTKQVDILQAPFAHRIAVYVRNLLPGVMASVMEKRARKQRKLMEKQK